MTLLNIISILLTLGTSPDCDGFGVCILEQQTEENKENCLKYDNCLQAEVSQDNREISFLFSQKNMKDAIYIKHFTTEHFRIDKDFALPDDITAAIGCQAGTAIPAGKYPIYEEGGKIVVKIRF